MKEFIQVVTTVNNQDDADRLSRMVLESRLVACVQITNCKSMYQWQGNIEMDNELRLTMKTSNELYPELEKILLKNHPYETPEIISFPIERGNAGYMQWLQEELTNGCSD